MTCAGRTGIVEVVESQWSHKMSRAGQVPDVPKAGFFSSKKELESADAPNSRVLKSEPLATSSPKAPAKQMSFAEQINIYKQLCDRFDPTPASSGTSSS
uniref:Uncharacterized protein n=1 Tax=Romanomermis culicivorax TaxID=13658 RepID=A0A915LB42_ROMCU